MSTGVEMDIRQLVLADSPFGPNEVERLNSALGSDSGTFAAIRDAVAQLEQQQSPSPATRVRLGVIQYLLGKYKQAEETLAQADGGALATYYLGKTHFANGNYMAAMDVYQKAAKAGYDQATCSLGRVEAMRANRDPEGALKLLDSISGAAEQSAEYLYQRGATIASLGGNPHEVIALYERAMVSNPRHPGAIFGLALENDRRGNDQEALELYQKLTNRYPTPIGALLNLGILYEDRQQYEKAKHCYLRILESCPTHPRARLYLKDAIASGEMFYDEDALRRRDKMGQVLAIPVTDFELSVRSRNCLQKMGVMTLGDLARTSEQELLSSKNFGETSLSEIKEMLASKGLQLGQLVDEKYTTSLMFEPEVLSVDEQALLGKSIAELSLSVRARKCMARLGISTIGELLRHTGDELLECKNFGVTSLNEVREKLTQHGLALRGD